MGVPFIACRVVYAMRAVQGLLGSAPAAKRALRAGRSLVDRVRLGKGWVSGWVVYE
jgi:hypothetical protein